KTKTREEDEEGMEEGGIEEGRRKRDAMSESLEQGADSSPPQKNNEDEPEMPEILHLKLPPGRFCGSFYTNVDKGMSVQERTLSLLGVWDADRTTIRARMKIGAPTDALFTAERYNNAKILPLLRKDTPHLVM